MKKRRRRKKYKKYAKAFIILAVISLIYVILENRDIEAVPVTDENVYVLADAIMSESAQYTIQCPDTITSEEEAFDYEHKLYNQTQVLPNVVTYSASSNLEHVKQYSDGKLTITYVNTGKERNEQLDALYDQETENVMAMAGDSFDTLTEREKVSLVIKYVADNYDYGKKEDGTKYNIQTSITESKTVVCSGYSVLVTAICQRLGIDCVTAVSKDHMWNAIKLDNNDYYTVVDLTNGSLGFTGPMTYYYRSLFGDYNIEHCEVVTRPADLSNIAEQIYVNIRYSFL